MPRLRIARPEARQIVLAWLTFNWSIRKIEARFHYAPSTIKRLLKYWRRHQALPHDTPMRRRDARCLNRKEKRLIRRKLAMHPFAYLREIRSYVEGHGCRRPSSSQIWRFCKEAKLTLKTVSSVASFLLSLTPARFSDRVHSPAARPD